MKLESVRVSKSIAGNLEDALLCTGNVQGDAVSSTGRSPS